MKMLLASFIKSTELDIAIESISNKLDIDKNSIFVFGIVGTQNYLLTYNVNRENFGNEKFSSIWPDTISIHRKKETNTLFSLNAMNEIIKNANNGTLDPKYNVDWEKYRDCLLLIRNGKLEIISLRLKKMNR